MAESIATPVLVQPIWVDLSSSDVPAARAFYSALFGWEIQDPPPEAGGYTMARLGGKLVAGLGPQMAPNMPPTWNSYVGTADADAVAKRVLEAGGQVIMPPMDVMTSGRMAVFCDPTGAFISVWQPGDMRGAEIFNVPGALGWNELNSPRIEEAKPFYEKVFGWTSKVNDMGGGVMYTEFQLTGRSIAGGMPVKELPPGAPPFWLVYFQVPDTNAAIAKIRELGGNVHMGPIESPQGPLAVVADPQGAAFAVIAVKG